MGPCATSCHRMEPDDVRWWRIRPPASDGPTSTFEFNTIQAAKTGVKGDHARQARRFMTENALL